MSKPDKEHFDNGLGGPSAVRYATSKAETLDRG